MSAQHLLLPLLFCAGDGAAAPDVAGAEELAEAYVAETRPLLLRYCAKCHSERRTEGEVNLAAFASFAEVRRDVRTWQKVREMVESAQMPPPAERQPSDDERARLRDWVRRMLQEEARRFAGDPGPVVLRRLSNAEYTYSIADLTGVDSLRPAAEFPVDGAAGEGFTNAGAALVMSPALLVKYLDAGKEVAAHALLTPDGIRFSSRKSRRDWADELLAEIRHLYAQYTDAQGATQVNLQGIVLDTNGGGRLPLERYFLTLLAARDALERGATSIEAIARERQLSAKYLGGLWELLSREPGTPAAQGALLPAQRSLIVDELRQRWQSATKPEEDAIALAAYVARWQQALWRFSTIGHIGKAGGPTAWMEPVNPIAARQELKLTLPATEGNELVLHLVAADAGDGNDHDFVVWERPRLTAPGRPELLLRDVRRVSAGLAAHRDRMIASTAKCLAAAAEAGAAEGGAELAPIARRHGVELDALAAWMDAVGLGLGLGAGAQTPIGAPITRSMASVAGYDFVQGWVGDDALSVLANSSDQHVRIPGNMAPHSVAVHPAPTMRVAVGWRSPISAAIRIEGVVQHAHPECGNGVDWALELRRGGTRQRLAAGTSQGSDRVVVGPLEAVRVRTGDLVALVIDPRGGDHSCDLTAIELTLGDGAQEWSLARDVSSDLLAGNPHPDREGRDGVWNFFSEPVAAADRGLVPAGSLLARWQSAASAEEAQRLAEELQRLLEGDSASLPKDSPDALLVRQLTSLGGPLLSTALQTIADAPLPPDREPGDAGFGLDVAQFGALPDGAPIDPASLCVRAPSVIEIRLPAELAAGAEFTTAGFLHPALGAEGSVQLQLLTERPALDAGLKPTAATTIAAIGPWTTGATGVAFAAPVVVNDGSAARRRFEAAFDDFRRWFPAAACYVKIVPVDEVVTLTLFHREDEPLRRLLLDDASSAQLDRLWAELHFVSQDALTLVDAFEQIWQYATQDADPKVFEPLRQPILDRAAAFRRTLVEAEPRHLDAVLALASRAFRRPLTEAETRGLRELYTTLRQEELPHEDAIRLLIARVLVSPAFLYRPEQRATIAPLAQVETPTPENAPPPIPAAPVSSFELATRLGFFLWSSLPDAQLRAAAADGSLREPDVLRAQTRRMVADARVRRLATEFATQWLHVYQFDEHDEKSPATFPTFAALRGAMYEEPVRFFTDLFQRDGSLLEVLDADHTFLNEDLAAHYGIAGVSGPEWRRVDGLKQQGRGGILAMAATLAKQSGASRTSPILRGNWVSEVLLGEKLPRPPKGVPLLPDVVPAGLTERQLIEQHSSNPTCARCHERIDPLGFSLEGFDGIGRERSAALAQAGSDTKAMLPDGTELDGLEGLRDYLLTTRREAWTRQFCRKLLGYALGRGVQLSDEPLLDEMQERLKAEGWRVQVAIEAIVTSRQFQQVRAGDAAATEQEGAIR